MHDNDIIVKKTDQESPAKFEMVLGILTMPRSGPPAEFGDNYFKAILNKDDRQTIWEPAKRWAAVTRLCIGT